MGGIDNTISLETKVRQSYERLTNALIERKLTITTMESATSGQIASLITDTPGASAIFKGAFITYCNEAKIMQGVPNEIIEQYSVYSKETALAMAKACQKSFDADIAVGVTGTMGNVDPANKEASVPGQVYFAVCVKNESGQATGQAYYVEIPPMESRLLYKLAVAGEISDILLKLIK